MTPGFDPQMKFLGELLNQFVRVGTPFFFLTSGYFFSVSVSRGRPPLGVMVKLVRRLALFAIFWSCVYLLLPIGNLLKPPHPDYVTAVLSLIKGYTRPSLLVTGTAIHLWFLPAMACALILLAIACRFRLEKYFAILAAMLFLIGLAGGPYAATPIGIPIGINTRNGPFFSSIFVFTGYLLHKYGVRLSLRTAYALILGGIALRLAELYWLTINYGVHPSKIDYLLGTYPFGVGIFVWLLNSPHLGENRLLVRLSHYSPGVYCAHLLFIDLLTATPLFVGSPLWEVTRPFLILGLTFAWVIILARVRFLRPVLT
jgi:surface polysaccharide O-acyltransferase-like enzyme